MGDISSSGLGYDQHMSFQDRLIARRSSTLESDAWLTVPNVLTILRIAALVPFTFWAMEGRDRQALLLFFIAGVTDTLDGTIARNFGQYSKLGRLLDPLADKLFTGAAFVVLSAFRRGLTHIPIWLMAAALLRDVLILSGSLVVYRTSRNSGFKPSVYGKVNTLFEIGVVVLFLAQTDLPFLSAVLPVCYIILLASLMISTADYLQTALRMMRHAPKSTG